MKRYKSRYGVIYEIVADGTGHLLSKVHTEVRLVRKKEVKTERRQGYMRSSFEDCVKYLHQIDVVEEI